MFFVGEIEINVVLYEDDGVWIAQGIEFDITARGTSPTDAARNFDTKVGEELVMSAELGDKKPLAGVPPAPKRFWQMYSLSAEPLDHVRSPIRILDDGIVPRVVSRMKIGELAAA